MQEMRAALGGAAYRVVRVHSGDGPYDFAPLIEVVEAQPVGFARDGAAAGVLKTWGNRDPEAAFAWYLDGEQGGDLHDRVLDGLADNFGAAANARDWLKAAPDHPFVDAVFGNVVRGFQSGDELKEWAQTLPPARMEVALKAAESMPK